MDVGFVTLKNRHPGLKVRLLSRAGYLQVFPGNLLYADNLYRFGYEIRDAQLVGRLEHTLKNWLAVEGEPISLAGRDIGELEKHAMTELVRSLVATPDSVERVSAAYTNLIALLPESYSRKLLRELLRTVARGLESTIFDDQVKSAPNQWEIFVSTDRQVLSQKRGLALTSTGAHVSVGALIQCDGKTLVVQKVTAPNRGLWSIPAGHCEWGECAATSIVRELREETGISAGGRSLAYAGEIDEGRPCRHGEARHLWFLYRIQLPHGPEVTLEAEELKQWKWVDTATLARLHKTPALEELLARNPID